jgi:tetratricopeptide (TPR) repeat protein
MAGPEDVTRATDAPDPTPSRALADTDSGGEAGPAGVAGPMPSPARYTLGEEVARGGMGVVYRAADAALGREVAVKVLQERFGPDSSAARRFADEARITAQLQHPNIPAVHDLGALPDGRPFLAMRLINGDTLDRMLAARPDPSHERGRFVGVFEQVCQAVAYAHAHGVIHRDLKPANVMVGAFGEVQVMDWGLAKVLQSRDREGAESDPGLTTPEPGVRPLRDGTFTQAGSVLGTPAFMPPEQAAGAVGQVDARSDVFGLGAILAVILTGKPPFAGGSAETIRVNAAQGKLLDCFQRLDACGADPELVALCKRCLAPGRDDRLRDAAAVAGAVASLRAAADERARQAELARAESAVREAEGRKRRRVWLGLAAALAAGLVAAVTLAVQANEARKAAESATEREADQRREAEEQTRLATDVKDFLKNDVLLLADPATQQLDRKLAYDPDVRLRDVVLRASRAIEGKFADRPLVEAELRATLAQALQGMGRVDLAAPHHQRVWSIRTSRLGPDHPETLKGLNELANAYVDLGRLPEALKLRQESLALTAAKLGPDHLDTLRIMGNLANTYDELGRYPEALKLKEEVVARLAATLGRDHADTLRAMNNLATTYDHLGRHPDALRLREETLALRTVKLGRDHPATLNSIAALADSYYSLGRHQDALKLDEESLALRKAKLGPDHPDTFKSMNNLANSYRSLGRLPDALTLHLTVVSLSRAKLGPGHPATILYMNNLARTYVDLGRHAEALKLREEALLLRRDKLGPLHPHTLDSAWGVVASLVALRRPGDALPRIEELLRLADQAEASGKPPAPRLRGAMMSFRLGIFRDRNDLAGCRQTAERLERMGLTDPLSLYDAARCRAVLARLLAGDPSSAQAEADRAMGWLTKALAAGYNDLDLLKKDTDLDALRDREDFRKLLQALPAKPAKK